MFSQLLYRGRSIEVLHDRYAKQGRIDDQAPVTTSYEIHIDAPVQRVWELLSNPSGWPVFDPDIRDVRTDAVAPDARFTWTIREANLTVTCHTSPPQEKHMPTSVARIRAGAAALAAAGALFLAYPALRPWHDENTATGATAWMSSNAWVAAHFSGSGVIYGLWREFRDRVIRGAG